METDIVKKIIKLIAIYARVSTARQEEDGTIETQLAAVREFAKKNGYTIVKEYVDDGWSGDMLARPALDELRQDAKQKVWEAVLIYDPDRLARRYSYQELVMDELREGGIEVLFVTTPAPKNGEERILHGVKGLFAEYERTKIAERFRLGKLRKAKEGHLVTSSAKYGYNYVPRDDKVHGYYTVNEDERKTITMIFRWIADEGLTIRKVIKRLEEQKIKPRKSKRGVWSTSTLSTLLHDRTYIGEAHYLKSYGVVPENPHKKEGYKKIKKTSRKVRPENEWIKIPVPQIIDLDLFERTQYQLTQNFALSERNKKNEYLLSGVIWCECGKRRAGEGPQHGKYLYYRCDDRVLSYPLPAQCKERGINARIADHLVWKKIETLMISPDLMKQQIKRWLNKRAERATAQKGSVADSNAQIQKLEKEEERYNKAYGAGLFSMDQLKDYTTPIRERITALKSEIVKMEQRQVEMSNSQFPSGADMRSFAGQVAKKLQSLNFRSKQAIVRNVLERVVGTQTQLQVVGFLPIDLSNPLTNVTDCSQYCNSSDATTLKEYVKSCSKHRHRRSSKRW